MGIDERPLVFTMWFNKVLNNVAQSARLPVLPGKIKGEAPVL